ncbi:MAG: MFS transporter, partial [Rhodobacteraceae bacterium]|nr:MFS transporter [Paracoccaceae bacterium]
FASAAMGNAFLGMILAIVVLISAGGSFYLTRGARFSERHEPTHHTVAEQIGLIAENRPFLILICCKLLGLLALSFQSVFPFFFTKVAGLKFADISVYFGIYSAMMFIVSPGWKWIGKKIGKRNAFMLALTSSAAVMATWYFAKAGDPYWFMVLRAVAYGTTACGTLMMGQALLPDTMEYDRRRTGLRREGIFAGLYTTVEKLAGAFGAGIAGVFFGAMGYVASRPGENVEQPESAIFAITIAMAIFPVAINLTSAGLMLFYDLSEEKLKATGLRSSTPTA